MPIACSKWSSQGASTPVHLWKYALNWEKCSYLPLISHLHSSVSTLQCLQMSTDVYSSLEWEHGDGQSGWVVDPVKYRLSIPGGALSGRQNSSHLNEKEQSWRNSTNVNQVIHFRIIPIHHSCDSYVLTMSHVMVRNWSFAILQCAFARCRTRHSTDPGLPRCRRCACDFWSSAQRLALQQPWNLWTHCKLESFIRVCRSSQILSLENWCELHGNLQSAVCAKRTIIAPISLSVFVLEWR